MTGARSNSATASTPRTQSRGRPGRRGTAIGIIILVLAWAAVMLFRMEIRAHWWAYQLTRVESRGERNYYLACLAAAGNKSLGAVNRLLLHDPRPEIRQMGVTVLEHCPAASAADKYLTWLLSDGDEDVAVGAALALASRGGTSWLLEVLQDRLSKLYGGRRRHAAIALQRIGGPQAQQILIEALPQTTDPDLRAQIVDSLGLMASERAITLLIDMLSDQRRVTVLPYSQRSALRALAALQGELRAEGIDAQAAADALGKPATVASVAARSLQMITGVSFGDPATRPAEDTEAIRRQWQRWYRQRKKR